MTGFKEGAASSGLDDESDDSEDDQQTTNQPREPVTDSPATEPTTESSDAGGSGSLPWIYRRSGITDGREKTVQLHLQQTTLDEEYNRKAELEEMLGETVNKADIREAAYLVGLSQLDEVTAQLREWGYDAD